jgi:hypothetical protein
VRQVRILVLLAVFAAFANPVSGASANLYSVSLCTHDSPSSLAASGLSVGSDEESGQPTNLGFKAQVGCGGGFAGISLYGLGNTYKGGIHMTLTAPSGASLHRVEFYESFSAPWASGVQFHLRTAEENVLQTEEGPPLLGTGTYYFDNLNSPSITGDLACFAPACEPLVASSPTTSVSFQALKAEIDDRAAPTVSIGSVLAAASPLHGTAQVPFEAADAGAGVATAMLLVDGAPAGTLTELNGGLCAQPYLVIAPCVRSLDKAFALDTTKLADGSHRVQVAVVDGAGLEAKSAPVSIVVDNAPQPSGGSGSAGSSAGGGSGSAAPALSAIKFSKARFQAAGGAVVRFSSSVSGTLTIHFERLGPGHRIKNFATGTLRVLAGQGKLKVGSRLGKKKLTPGRYRLTLSVRDAAGHVSKPIAAGFRVLAPR